jgi:hypothetical protein
MKFDKLLVVPSFLYGSECFTLTQQKLKRTESADMRFFRLVTGYSSIDKTMDQDIRQELNIFNLTKKI